MQPPFVPLGWTYPCLWQHDSNPNDKVEQMNGDQIHVCEVLLELVDLILEVKYDGDLSKSLNELHPYIEACVNLHV